MQIDTHTHTHTSHSSMVYKFCTKMNVYEDMFQ